MYTTNVREPVRADEKHLGRVKRHFIDTDVQLGNYELREVSRYQVALKAARTSRGVPLFEDIPGLGILFRPLPSAESSLQENIVLAQSTIFPTLFDLMGLRWAPAVADLDTLRLRNSNFVVRGRNREVENRVFDYSSAQVDEFLRIPASERRPDLYRPQQTIPDVHPDGYRGPGQNYRTSRLREGYDPSQLNPESVYTPGESREAPDPLSQPSDDPVMQPLPADGPPLGPPALIEPGAGTGVPTHSPFSPTRGGARPPSSRSGTSDEPMLPPLNGPATTSRPGKPKAKATAASTPTSRAGRDGAVMPARSVVKPGIPSPPAPSRPALPASKPNGVAKADATPKTPPPARRGILSRFLKSQD
jgi:hypothetical protein